MNKQWITVWLQKTSAGSVNCLAVLLVMVTVELVAVILPSHWLGCLRPYSVFS